MSQLIGASQPQFILRENEIGIVGSPWQPERESARASDPQNYTTPWWPRSGFLGDYAADISVLKPWYFEQPEIARGTNSRFGYQGVSRDVNNSPLGGCTIKLFLTADDTKVTPDIVSGADGTFVISTPNYAPHWLRMSKAGSPDLQCTTVSTSYPNT
jgi:hypothetical protein